MATETIRATSSDWAGYRERCCPEDEQHLTLREREKKVIAEAQAAGKTIERAPA